MSKFLGALSNAYNWCTSQENYEHTFCLLYILYIYITDVAIGAPYAGPGDKGAVYIYNGGKTGIVITGNGYSQVCLV